MRTKTTRIHFALMIVFSVGLTAICVNDASAQGSDTPFIQEIRTLYEQANVETNPSLENLDPTSYEYVYNLWLMLNRIPDPGSESYQSIMNGIRPALDIYHIDSTPETRTENRRIRYLLTLINDHILELEEKYSVISGQIRMSDREVPGVLDLYIGHIARRQFRYESAVESYTLVLSMTDHPVIVSQAYIGLAQVYEKQYQYQRAVDSLMVSLRECEFSPDALYWLGRNLVRLGRVAEATQVFELAHEINPSHERAHYYLGNGYARYNYTQLEEIYPEAFQADSAAVAKRDEACWYIETNEPEEIIRSLQEAIELAPNWVEPKLMLASIYWTNQDLEPAEELVQQVLELVPEHGRAHAIYAKIMEMRRMRWSQFRESDNQVFSSIEMPEVPGIEDYIFNWHTLTERHRKQVAMAVYPWRHFVPVLVATGSTHYIKPLYERLSESPYMESMEDQRIGLDSRLWDDVRGCGGYHTVTGVEDVERMIYHGSNTVIHELTHQVHYILTDEEKDLIEATYREAKRREENGIPTFMSRYQSLTEWEYFAEGVNSYHSPQRNEYDDYEITRERLYARDTALVALVEHFTSITDVSPYYAIGMVNASNDHLQEGLADLAANRLEAISAEYSEQTAVLNAKSNVYSILDRDSEAIQFARRSIATNLTDADGYLSLSSAFYYQESSPDSSLWALRQGLAAGVEARHELYNALGNLYWETGDWGNAVSAYDSVLAVQSDHPGALWGKALALGDWSLAGGFFGNDSLYNESRRYFEQVLEIRTGIVELRMDYARILLLNGDVMDCLQQITEAQNLRPNDPLVKSMQAWIAMRNGEPHIANHLLQQAASNTPVPDLVHFLMAINEGAETRNELQSTMQTAIPSRSFNSCTYSYETEQVYPYWMQSYLQSLE